MITVFTPTYNRAHLLQRVFDSLMTQTVRDFEWVIVDDGSADDTESVVNGFVAKAGFPIVYIKQNNGGKHRAINRGVSVAKGELFFIVDADDWLPETAVEDVINAYDPIRNNVDFGGICGLDMYSDGKVVGSGLPQESIDCSSLEIRYQYNVTGDLKEVFRTEVLKEFPFPEYDGEKFCPEALVWNRIALKYKLRFINKAIYYCEYQSDGLTANIMRVRHNSPLASMTMYSELAHLDIPFVQKLKASVNFWRFTPCKYYSKAQEMRMLNVVSLLTVPFGVAMRVNDKRHLR